MWFAELLVLVFGLYVAVSVVFPGKVYSFLAPVALLVLGSAYIVLEYRAWGFEVRDDHLYLEYGVFTKVKTMVPFVRIQHVDTQRNALERVFGISRVVVYTAGTRGSDVKAKGLLPGEADSMQEKLRDVAIESEDRDAV